MSTRSHDKTVETADNPVYDVLFFFFLQTGFLVCFQESFNTRVSSRYSVCRWIFFVRDHRRTSPFSNLFKILLDFGTKLLLFPICFISECSFFVFYSLRYPLLCCL